jgi:hypothetical protein
METPENEPTEIVETAAIELIERAQIDLQISTAKKYPRKLSKVKDDMMSFAALDEETAAGCFYTVPRGGKAIQGPSIRLAEIAISCYTNLRAGSRCISVQATGDNPHVVVQSICHDLEKNVAITIEKRRRITKKKKNPLPDEDDINLAVNACAAIALRDATFKVIPLALIKPVYEHAKLVAIGKATSLGEKRNKIIDRLKQMGATLPNILAVVEARAIDDVDADKLGILIGLGTALKDGETTIEEAFPSPKVATNESMGDVLGDKKAAAPTTDKPKAETAAGNAPTGTTEPTGPAYTEAELKAAVVKLENIALNMGLSEAKLIAQAKNMPGVTLPKDARKLTELNFATVQTLIAWCQAQAAG